VKPPPPREFESAVTAEPERSLNGFDMIEALRFPNCDALFEYGGFVTARNPSKQTEVASVDL
jgi:hypothetical protein